IARPDRLGWMVLGCAVGLVVGLLPGLGGTVGMSILLPFVFGMDPYSGVALLIGMAAVIHTGRSEEHTSELQSLMRISYAVFCLNKLTNTDLNIPPQPTP